VSLDARALAEIPEHWAGEAPYWRNVPFVWKRWTQPHDEWTHDHCLFCWACICGHRDQEQDDLKGAVDGGHYRPDGTYVWVCRSCFKRVQTEFGWTRGKGSDG
jgi:hypothetical protein